MIAHELFTKKLQDVCYCIALYILDLNLHLINILDRVLFSMIVNVDLSIRLYLSTMFVQHNHNHNHTKNVTLLSHYL